MCESASSIAARALSRLRQCDERLAKRPPWFAAVPDAVDGRLPDPDKARDDGFGEASVGKLFDGS